MSTQVEAPTVKGTETLAAGVEPVDEDRSCHVTVLNNSPYTLTTISYKDIHGDWKSRPSAAIKAGDSNEFWLKDVFREFPSNIP